MTNSPSAPDKLCGALVRKTIKGIEAESPGISPSQVRQRLFEILEEDAGYTRAEIIRLLEIMPIGAQYLGPEDQGVAPRPIKSARRSLPLRLYPEVSSK